jgi:hypothetical protein
VGSIPLTTVEGTGRVPQVRISVPGPKMICFDCFFQLIDFAKSYGGFARLNRPRYADANLGHPSSSYWVLLGD